MIVELPFNTHLNNERLIATDESTAIFMNLY